MTGRMALTARRRRRYEAFLNIRIGRYIRGLLMMECVESQARMMNDVEGTVVDTSRIYRRITE